MIKPLLSCWKHNRQLSDDGICRDCNGKPPQKPKAFSNTIKETAIKLTYAFTDIENEAIRQQIAEYWENKLREIIKRDYEIIEIKIG